MRRYRKPLGSPFSRMTPLQKEGFRIGVENLLKQLSAEKQEARQDALIDSIHQKLEHAGAPQDYSTEVIRKIHKALGRK